VKREDIRAALDRIRPEETAKKRMIANILNYSEKRNSSEKRNLSSFNFRRAVPAFILVIVFAGGILAYGLRGLFFGQGPFDDGNRQITDMIGEDSAAGMEDMAAPLVNQFRIGGKHYILMSDYAEEFGFPAVIEEKDIGGKIATIRDSVDKSLVGCEVFSYIPAGCEAVVAVKKGDDYVLFKFFTFESYINNQDEDAVEYLKLYGIERPEDISRIRFIVYDEKSRLEDLTNVRSEITDRNEIARFYSFYSVLKDSSDRYFEKLYGYNPAGNQGDIEIDIAYPAGRETEIDIAYPDKRDSIDPPVARPVDPIPPDYMPPAPEQTVPGYTTPVPDRKAPGYKGSADETVMAYPGYSGVAEDLPLRPRVETGNAATAGDTSAMIDPSVSAPAVGRDTPVSGGSDTPISVIIDRGEGNASSEPAGIPGMGEGGAGAVAPSQGSAGDALAYPVAIRIYNQNGVYFEMMYYRNIGFLSRYEITAEFAAFIENHIK
jgi:hypothetical protein